MSESPSDDNYQTRFSTPVNELDDHRNQPESLPRVDPMQPQRRGTAGTIDLGSPRIAVLDAVLQNGFSSIDFEEAIIDDSRRGSYTGEELRAPGSPIVARRNTFRRPRNHADKVNRSRDSSKSSRSISPPNSVDAFAGRRQRGRAGTITSIQAPSFAHSLRARQSEGTLNRARTYSEDHGASQRGDSLSDQGSVEDDVCFPQPDESSNPYTIDFEDLHEFVLRNRVRTPVRHPTQQHYLSAKIQQGRVFDDLRPRSSSFLKDVGERPKLGRMPTAGRDDANSSDFDEKFPSAKATRAETVQRSGFGNGEPINRWSFFSTELEESIHAPDLGDLLMPGETFKHLFELGPEGGCWWLDMLMPSEEEVEIVCKAFGVHGLTREDIVEQETREKVELFKSYYFVCFRSFYQMDKTSEFYMEPINVYAVVFREGILTFTFCPSPHAANVRKRMGKLRDYVALGSDWICYALIDDIVDSFGPAIRSIEVEADAIEDMVFTARMEDSRAVLRQVGECRKTVNSLLRLLGGKADVIKGFAKRCNEQYSITPRSDVGMYLSDIQDHVVTMMSNLGHFEKVLSRSHSNYLAQIQVDNIQQGNRANETLGKVTLIATILVPLNLVCGLFGMNVRVPGRDSESFGWFFGIIGFMALFVLGICLLAKRLRFV